jgi:hypothetical protein
VAGRQFSPFLFLFIFCHFLCCPLFSAVFSDEDSGYFDEEDLISCHKKMRKVRHRHFWEDYEPFNVKVGPKKKPKKRKSQKECSTSESIAVLSQKTETIHQALSLQRAVGVRQASVQSVGFDWRDLPNEVWGIILRHAGFTTALQLSSTCRDFNRRFGFLRAFANGQGRPDPTFNHHPSLVRELWRDGYDLPTLSLRSMFGTERDMNIFIGISVPTLRAGGVNASLEKIRKLDLGRLPEGTLREVFALLPHLSGLEELRMDHTLLRRATLMGLSASLREQRKVKNFCLQGCGLDDGSLDMLFRLGQAFQPHVLDVRCNQLRGNVSKSVQQWFKRHGGSLKELDMSENPIPDVHQLVRVIKHAKRIEVLKLGGVGLTPQSGHELFQDIFNTSSPHSRLKKLDLRGTGVAISLKDLLKPLNNPALSRILYLDAGSLTVGGSFEFLPANAETSPVEILKNEENLHKMRIRKSLSEKELNEFVHSRRPSIRHFEVVGEFPKSSLSQIFAFTNASTLGLGKWVSDDQTMQSIAQYVAQHPHVDTLLLNSALLSPRAAFKLMVFLKNPVLEVKQSKAMTTPPLKKKKPRKQQAVVEKKGSSPRPLTVVFSSQLRPFEASLNDQKPDHITLDFRPTENVKNKTLAS